MLLVNVNTKQFIPSAGSNFIQPVESRDQIIYGTRVEVRFQLYNPDGTVFALNESDTFCCAGDINFIHTDDLMFYSGHEMCRIIDAAQGIVGVTIDATSDSFADKATSQNTRMYVQLKRHVAGDTLGDTVLQDIVYAQPAVMTTEGAPASSDPEYMTAAATLALLRTAPDYQFSVDGETNWHDQQDIAADRFYRERRNGGEWGPAIELIEGKTGPTGAAAGFGTPTVAVESLPAGSDATASVTASGDNTAKVFSFNFGIPKGADGQNGTNGAAGADGVSSYTYVAYASDASGTGFSLTPTNALKYRAEIHTTTAIETPDAEDFAGATWVKYLGDDGTGAGDMTKSVYDTNNDGIVDHAATADTVGATTAAQVADAVSKAHTHANKTTLDKLAEADGKLTYDGAEIGGGSGTVKSVNGQLPDESGNVTVETGGAVDESRLLPTGGKDGDILGYQEGTDQGNGSDVRLLLQNAMTDSANGNAAPAAVTTQGVTLTGDNNLLFDGNDSHVTAVLATDEIFAADKEWTIDFWMKPTANSSEWNYILTENRGDWGSHSIGLTWNKTKNVLEQDTGGYLASVIRSSNWPNDSVACAASEWHFVAVEKQKTASGWNLNYYLNGAIWLQVAFTADFVPFDASDNPFWFGGKTTDSGRWFKGEVNKLRVTMGARYGGKAFAVPDRLTDYAAPAGQPVWAEGIDRSRLLPENPVNGDIPCFDATATIGGGNDANTKILLHFDADEIKDEAAGNAAPAPAAKKAGTITIVDGGKFDKCAQFVTGSMTVATRLDELNANNWVVSGWFNPDENNHGVSYPVWLSMDDNSTNGFFFDSTGRYGESDGPLFYLDTPPASGTWHWLAIVKYSGGLRFYLNGAFLNEISAQQRANFCSTLAIGGFAGTYAAGSTERTFSGLVDEVRLQYIPDDEITLWTGTSIAVPDAPYSKPQTVGEWGKLNKSALVQNVNGQLPDSSGAVTLPEATVSTAGLMAAADKVKLDSLIITESKARPGYFKLPGGTIVQWGAASNITADGSTQITFPVAFPNAFLIGNATTVSGNASASGVVVSLTAVTVTGMTLIIKNHPGNSNDINVHWLAIGY